MAHEEVLAALDRRRAEASRMGGPAKLAKRNAQGQLSAQQRLDALVDPGSFLEVGLLGASNYDAEADSTPRDGKITGFGRIDGRDVGVVVNDFTVKGASTGATNSKKMGYIRKACTEKGMPFVHIGEFDRRTFARRDGLQGHGFNARKRHDPVSPHARHALGRGRAGHLLRIVGVALLLRRFFGDEEGLDHVGLEPTARFHGDRRAGRSRGARGLAPARRTDRIDRPFRRNRRAGNGGATQLPVVPAEPQPRACAQRSGDRGVGADQERILALLPEKRTQVYNMKAIIEVIVDRGTYFEIKPRFGRPATVGLARLGGMSVGIIANNPQVGGGALSAEACRKIIDFTVLCDSFNIPIVRLIDTPGFVVGLDAERRGAPGHIMNFMNATCLTTVPQITVICRKAYGRAYVAMGGGAHNDAMLAWPGAEVSFMDPVFATSIVKNKSPGDDGFEDALAEIQQNLEIWDMARIFSAQDVIKPQETRASLIRLFDIHRRRRSGGIGEHLMRTWPTSY